MTKFSGPPRTRAILLLMLAAFGAAPLLFQPSPAHAETARSSDPLSYVLLHEGTNSSSMSGSMDDLRRAQNLRSGQEELLYVRQGDAAYVIRDAATLRQARDLFKRQEELGERQGELGSKQAALGERQAKLGEQQARLGALQANASASWQAELGRQQGELGRQQGELGRQQGILGQQQGELGRQQGELARIASRKLRILIADALRRGLAQRVN